MARAYIPVSATEIGRLHVRLPDGGENSMITYHGVASKGYKSNYDRTLTYWVTTTYADGYRSQNSMTPAVFAEHIRASLDSLADIPPGVQVLVRTGCYLHPSA